MAKITIEELYHGEKYDIMSVMLSPTDSAWACS